ncbi:hypothetical protein L227DRAFT_498019 [Lentinus tigrinus ALCF2SS1-6]|uniref:Uncharacterized protein n=1 Tax=Lentinus tigrinus ALCF2SS1-6 TaxID=1328759 RepID=A0A5C2SH24_9APHY|nr:hypothetical protein L227DRAFT_498019 [Lentinus tigrinus ALCF2SS1-6]
MASQDADVTSSVTNSTSPSNANSVNDVVEAVAKVSLQDEVAADVNEKTIDSSPRPLKVYTRYGLLHLSKSPLVGPPQSMPAFKDWFGDWNEQVGSKKESESSTATNARDRRFRTRDTDDSESTRTSFRSGLSQPSQMGNFRHQSIRTTDRIGEKDFDRERERDLRDREGQERIRNLSDKYDRDRLAGLSASNLRNKERDAAPHLSGTSTSRLGQSQTAGRRGEGRDTPKRKAGESSDDWRRGAEPNKAGRDDRTDPRRDRDTRERPRSRVRDASRTRREPSTTRRDRDRDRDDKDRTRDRRGDGDRDDRRDRDDFSRRDWDDYDRDRERDDHYPRDARDRYEYGRRPRDREADRDVEEDPRRWRDDGRRDERMAVRREREARERNWDRFEDRDRERPSAGDDRDGRNRRGVGRDRRLGGANDDPKDREDRRDRDKEREAEPAWMETYIPTTPGGGILGGKSADGELDGIQAWKKGMKEKERKEKGEVSTETGKGSDSNATNDQPTSPAPAADGQMDEIQLFKLMMKREAERKDGDKAQNGLLNALAESGPPGLSNSPSLQSQKNDTNGADPAIVARRPSEKQNGSNTSPRPDLNTATLGTSQPVIAAVTMVDSVRVSESSSPSLDRVAETSRVVGPRMGQVTPGIAPSSSTLNALPPIDLTPNPPASTFNPPPGSRVLALKSRVPSGGSAAPSGMGQLPPGIAAPHAHALPPGVSGLPGHLPEAVSPEMQFGGPRMTPTDSARGIRSFSPLSNGSQHNIPLEDLRESVHLAQMNEGLRRASGSSATERAILGLSGEAGSPFGELGGLQPGSFPPGGPLDPSGSNVLGGANYAASKGSRFAKFFDSKTREAQAGPRLGQQVPGMPPGVSHQNPRQESISLGGIPTPRGERTMEDIFAMLQSSAQGHRVSPQIPQTGRIPQSGGQFAQANLEFQLLQQQQHQLQQQQQQQQQLAQTRLDSLYESRLDDRFVPDGLVPGLRPAPPRSRSRESGGVLFNEQIDDPLHFNVQRLTQQRNMEQMFNNGPMPSMYNQQAGMLRNGGHPIQQGQFRGASPISGQNSLQPPSQRLPPGLANLGGRPPHDPSQYLGSGVGLPGGGLHGVSPAQQVYNTFTQGGLGFNGNPGARGPPGPQNPLPVNAMGGLGPNNVDLRAVANQAQLLGLAQGNLGGGGMRGSGPGFGPQHGPGGQLGASHLGAMRQQHLQQQQQQQHIPPHMIPHLLPSHLQQQGMPGGNAQTTQDLMALLMGGHRE